MGVGFLPSQTPFGIAHRGGRGGGPENTTAAFLHAVELGFSHLETDVHLTSDGVVVAFHDENLDRMMDHAGRIADHTWLELSQLKFGGGHAIPRFDDLLHLLPDTRFNIDPKADEAVEPLCKLIQQADAVDRVCIGAFSDRRIRRAKELLGPELCTSPGPKELAGLLVQARAGRSFETDHNCLQIPTSHLGVRLDGHWLVSRFHEAGLQIHYWTVNDRGEMERLLEAGADAIITDETETLREVLGNRKSASPGS